MNTLEKLLFERSIDLDSMDAALAHWAESTSGELQSLLLVAREVLSAHRADSDALSKELAEAREALNAKNS